MPSARRQYSIARAGNFQVWRSRLKRSSSAAARISPSLISAADASCEYAESPRMYKSLWLRAARGVEQQERARERGRAAVHAEVGLTDHRRVAARDGQRAEQDEGDSVRHRGDIRNES